MQPQIAKMPGRDRKPTLTACKIIIIQKKERKKKEGADENFQSCSIRDAHVRTQVQTLDDRHHLHVSVNVIIVVGNRSSKRVAFRTLGETWGFANR